LKIIYNILIIEPSIIIQEGLSNIIKSVNNNIVVTVTDSLSDCCKFNTIDFNIVLLNPILLNNCSITFNKFTTQFNKSHLLGIISTIYNRNFYCQFNDYIYINDNKELIKNTILKFLTIKNKKKNISENILSKRETDVLKLLAQGKSNKEIAEALFISIHTVVTHRKNIGRKLDVKSSAAMAIYAVANNIIDINDSLK